MAVVLALSSLAVSASEEVIENDAKLQFNSDGKFKIMHVPDIQDNVCIAPQSLECIAMACDDEQPALIVLGGDNVSSAVSKGDSDEEALKKVKRAFSQFMSIFEERNIPTALVFGNHDGNHLVPKETEMEIYNTYDCCIATDEGEDIYGCGTYNIPIMSSDGESMAYNLWFIDSNETLSEEEGGGYDYVRDDQVEWYVNKSNELKRANGGEAVPSIMFQHIPIPEIHDAVENGTLISGQLNRTPRPSKHASSQFSAVLKQGDVKAMFFGHDHVNTYTINYKGIDLVATPTAGVGAYGDENKGVRIIELDEKDTSTYETRLVNFLDEYCKDETQYFRFKMNDRELELLPAIYYSIRYIFSALAQGKNFITICYELHCRCT